MVHQRLYIRVVLLRNGFELWGASVYIINEVSGESHTNLKAVNTFDFLLEDFIHEAVLLDYWDSFERRARNGNSVEGPTAT